MRFDRAATPCFGIVVGFVLASVGQGLTAKAESQDLPPIFTAGTTVECGGHASHQLPLKLEVSAVYGQWVSGVMVPDPAKESSERWLHPATRALCREVK